MQSLAAASIGILIAASIVVAVRLLALYRRTRAWPELLLGGMLLLSTGIGYPLRVAAERAGSDPMGALVIASNFAIGAGYSLLFVFTWRVFRPRATWARVLAAAGVITLLWGSVHGLFGIVGREIGEQLFQAGPVLAAGLWTACESLRYHGMMRRRVKLGMADVAVSNRFLLWGLMGLSQTLGVVVSMGVTVVKAGALVDAGMLLFASTSGIVQAMLLVLAFLPPRSYLDWVESRAAAAPMEEPAL